MRRSLACALLAAVLLGGCAIAPPVVPGETREGDLLGRYGRPSEQWDLPDGSKVMMYSDTPMGYGTTKFVVGPDFIVRSVEPVINEEHFARLQPGMTEDEVGRELGRPGEFAAYPNLDEHVWSWRYVEFGNRRMFFNAHFDSAGRLKSTSRTPEPEIFRRHLGLGGFGF